MCLAAARDYPQTIGLDTNEKPRIYPGEKLSKKINVNITYKVLEYTDKYDPNMDAEAESKPILSNVQMLQRYVSVE